MFRCYSVVFLAVLPVSPLFAADEIKDPATLPPVTVEATRLPSAVAAFGTPVWIQESDAIARAQDQSISDALRDTPGITVMRSGGTGSQTSVFMRGSDSDHTLLLLDGVRAMDTAHPSGAAAWDHLLAIGIGRLEVLPGPQGPLYGSDAIGGVVSASTPRGRGPANLTLGGEYGSRNSSSVNVVGQGGDERFGWYAGVSRTDTNGFSAATLDTTENDDYRNTALATRLSLDPSDTTPYGADLVIRHARATVDFDDESGFTASQSALSTDAMVSLLKVAPRWQLAEGQIEQSLSLNYFESSRKSAGMDWGYPSQYTGKAWGADFQTLVHATRTLDWVVGAEYRLEAANNRGDFSTFDAETGIGSLYAQGQWRPNERLTLNLGGRLEDHQSFGTHATWKTSAAYNLAATNSTLRSSIGTGYKAPTLAELYDTTFGANNPLLQPEESQSYEAGVDQHFIGTGDTARLTISATWFQNDIDQLIVGFPSANAREARTRGLETSVSWKVLQGGSAGELLMRSAYTYTDAVRLDTGQDLLRRPAHQASVSLDYQFPGEKSSIGVVARYIGKRMDIDPSTFSAVEADARFAMDCVGRWKCNPRTTLTSRIENLFDSDTPEVLGFNPTPFGVFVGIETVLK